MPSLNSLGEWCSGVAGVGAFWGKVNSDDSIVGQQVWSEAGGTQWLTDDEICAQRFEGGNARLAKHNIRTEMDTDIVPIRVQTLITSKHGDWAIHGDNKVIDSYDRTFPEAAATAMGPDSSYCLKVLYQSYGPWDVIRPHNRFRLTDGDASQLVNYGDDRVTWVEAGVPHAINVPIPQPISSPFWWMKLIQIDGVWWQLYQTEKGSYFHVIGSTKGHIITTGNFFRPDIVQLYDKRIRIILAVREGETVEDIRAWTKNPYENMVNLTEEPQPVEGEPMIPAFERPMWQAPYFSHHIRYGDTPKADHVGNAIAVIGDERDESVRDSELARINNLGFPMIVDIGTHPPEDKYSNLTVAWLAAGGNVAQLVDNVERALTYIEKPVIAYLDNTDWPISNPFNSDRVWPSIQAYRFPTESANDFITRMVDVIDRVSNYKLPMCLVTRFDDFNGSSSIQRTLECMPDYETWLHLYNFVAHMPFADRRGNGIAKNPELHEWARAFLYAIPFGRPNRFDYWKPSGVSIEDTLKNKFGQTRASIVLEPYLREDILRRYLQ